MFFETQCRPTFGRKRFALCYRTVVLSVLSVLCVCDVGVLWPNGWMDQDETWRGGRPRPQPHCVRWDPASPKRAQQPPPHFSAHVLWPNSWMDKDAAWCGGIGHVPGHIVLRVNPAPHQKGHSIPQFSAVSVVAKRLDESRCHSAQATFC